MYCKVTSVCVFHQDAERTAELLEEGAFIGDDIGRVNGGKKSDLVEGIIFFPSIELHQFDLLHGVDLVIFFVFSDLDDPAEAS